MNRGFDFLFGQQDNFTIASGIPDPGYREDADAWGYNQNTNTLNGDNTNPYVRSKFNKTRFINYRGQKWNRDRYKPYGVEKIRQSTDESDSNKENQHNTSIESLLEWSKDVRMMTFQPRDFLYCKDLGKYSNNRLVVLRRYAGPIGNQVFGPGVGGPTPISTIVSWMPTVDGGGGDKLPYSISFAEAWEHFDDNLFEVLSKTLSELKIPIPKIVPSNPLFKTLQLRVMKALGITNLSVQDFVGNPNVISSTHARPNAKDSGADGLKSDIKFTIEAAYELRYINGVDPATVMLDILGNIIRMGTSDSVFQIAGGFANGVGSLVTELINGNIMGMIKKIAGALIDALKTLFDTVVKTLENFAKAVSSGGGIGAIAGALIDGIGRAYFEAILSEKRAAIFAAMAASTGAPNGQWHVMVGNPKKPIMSCGDLVIQNVTLEFENELGYDDWPTIIYATFELISARPRGAQELESIFNAGQQRIYYTGFAEAGQKIIAPSDVIVQDPNAPNGERQVSAGQELPPLKETDRQFELVTDQSEFRISYPPNSDNRSAAERGGTENLSSIGTETAELRKAAESPGQATPNPNNNANTPTTNTGSNSQFNTTNQ